MELEEIKRLHDKAFTHNQSTRERAADDMLFSRVTQWDDSLLSGVGLQYRGEFNIVRKATRQIQADLAANQVQVNFEPTDDNRDDSADLLDGLYRADDRVNMSIEAYNNGSNEAVECGIGAWELFTEYKTNRAGDNDQVIRRRPIYEANNNCFFDPNAKLLDKSDMKYCSILEAYSPDGYRDLVTDLTGEDPGKISAQSFAHPEHSYTFPWVQQKSAVVYVVRFYHAKKVKDTIYTMIDPLGMTVAYRQSDLAKQMDTLIDSGYSIVNKKTIWRKEVTLYIASGERILSSTVIAGENIPVVPCYGERMWVEGEEIYEGVTRLAKDPQRLRNFQMSYLADIVSRSPRTKPMYLAEQIQGFEDMYSESGPDNNYPYLLQNRTDANGEELPMGPVGVLPEQPMPQALAESIMLSRQAVEDVANPGLPQDIADPDLSGKAVLALQARLDNQSMVYQNHIKQAKRRDAEIYAAMASEVYDAPRTVKLAAQDGSTKTVTMMQQIFDSEGNLVTLNDLTNVEFEVFADIGPTYVNKKQETMESLSEMAMAVKDSDPQLHLAIIMKMLQLSDGVEVDDLRDYARRQLVSSGFTEPETAEEMQLVQEQQAKQDGQQDPMLLAAQAEILKGQADMAKAENDRIKIQLEAGKLQQSARKLSGDEMKLVSDVRNTDAATLKTFAEVEKINAETTDMVMESDIRNMPTEELIALLQGSF